MASLDFCRDLTEKLRSQHIDYLLVSIQKGSKVSIVDVFDSITGPNSLDILEETLIQILDDIQATKRPNAPKKKKRKKKDDPS